MEIKLYKWDDMDGNGRDVMEVDGKQVHYCGPYANARRTRLSAAV